MDVDRYVELNRDLLEVVIRWLIVEQKCLAIWSGLLEVVEQRAMKAKVLHAAA
jgi:hypothetical protein